MKPSLIELSPIKLPDPRVLIKLKSNALRRAANRARTRAASQFKRFGIGRRLFDNASAKTMSHLFSTGRLVDDGKELGVDVSARGLAGLQELGLRTKAHVISAESNRRRKWREASPTAPGANVRPRLAFVGRNGRVIRPFSVRHPGGLMKKYPVIPKELETALTELDRDVALIMREHL